MNNALSFAQHMGRYLVSKGLVHMIVHVTNHCNFRCDHCFIDFSTKRDLRLDKYKELGAAAGKLFWLDIGGGEPFIRKDLADIVAAFDSDVVQIPTNGWFTDATVEQCRRMVARGDREVVVSLSVDGLRETHDRIRHQEGSWDRLWQTFEALKRVDGVHVKALTVVHNGNVDEIIPLMHEVRKYGPDHHSVILVRGETISDDVELPPIDVLRELGAEIAALQEEAYDYGQNRLAARVLRNYHRFVWDVSLRILEEQRQTIPCLAGKTQLVVYGDGRVSSCEMLEPVGDLRIQSFAEIRDSQPFRAQVADIVAGKCHCTHNCALMDSIFFNPRNIPQLLK